MREKDKNERIKEETDPATDQTFRQMLEAGESADKVALTLLNSINNVVFEFMESVPQNALSKGHRWNIIGLAVYIGNALMALDDDLGPKAAVVGADELRTMLEEVMRHDPSKMEELRRMVDEADPLIKATEGQNPS